MTPIFSRSWLMKMSEVFDLWTQPVSLRRAWDMSRACRPTCESPIFALELGLGDQRCNGVDDDDVDSIRPHEHLGNLERLLTRIGLAEKQLVDVDADLPRVARIERVFGVDEGGDAAGFFCAFAMTCRDKRGLARRLRTEDLDDAAARDSDTAEREVERDGARRNPLDLDVAGPHRAS